MNHFGLLLTLLFAELQFLFRLMKYRCQPGILSESGDGLAREIDRVRQLMARKHPLGFTNALFEQLLLSFFGLFVLCAFSEVDNLGVGRKLRQCSFRRLDGVRKTPLLHHLLNPTD